MVFSVCAHILIIKHVGWVFDGGDHSTVALNLIVTNADVIESIVPHQGDVVFREPMKL